MQVRLWVQWATGGFTDLSDNGGSFLRTYEIEQAAASEECRFPTSRMAGVLRAARDLNEHPHSRRRQVALLGLWKSWTESEGADHLLRALERDMRTCSALRDQVHATYRVTSEPTPRGKDVAINITIKNTLNEEVAVNMAGSMLAHGLLPKMPGGPARTRSVVWGGLEGDEGVVRGRSVQTFRQNVNDYRKHLSFTDTGSVSRLRARVDAWPERTGIGCNLPVPAG